MLSVALLSQANKYEFGNAQPSSCIAGDNVLNKQSRENWKQNEKKRQKESLTRRPGLTKKALDKIFQV